MLKKPPHIFLQFPKLTLHTRLLWIYDQLISRQSFFRLDRQTKSFATSSPHPIPLNCGFVEFCGGDYSEENAFLTVLSPRCSGQISYKHVLPTEGFAFGAYAFDGFAATEGEGEHGVFREGFTQSA